MNFARMNMHASMAKIFKKKDLNPNGISIHFKIAAGAKFVAEGVWRRGYNIRP